MITIEQAQSIITALPIEFDTHDFIECFSRNFEREYVEIIHSQIDSNCGIFKSAHAEIGRFLSKNKSALNIKKDGIENSRNIKGYDSPNQGWEKEI